MKLPRLEFAQLHDLLCYDQDTGIFTNRVRRGPAAAQGVQTGCVSAGVTYLFIDGVKQTAARVAWFMSFNEWPTELIMRRDKDTTNDALGNLYTKSHPDKTLRPSIFPKPVKAPGFKRGRKSGFAGVESCSGKYPWMVRIWANGKKREIGRYMTEEEASAAYIAEKTK